LSANENSGCLGGLFRLFGGGATASPPACVDELPYRLRDDFLSQAEASFFRVLKSTVGDKAVVLAKVNLADIFFVARPNENKGARSRISQKHVDFLLIDSQTLRPVVAIELDDSSHQRADRQARDELVDSVFKAAGLALLHIPVRQAYSVVELSSQLEPLIGGEPPSLQASEASPTATQVIDAMGPPVCSKCGTAMVLRTTSKGERRGQQFYGCSNYPKCREVAPLGH